MDIKKITNYIEQNNISDYQYIIGEEGMVHIVFNDGTEMDMTSFEFMEKIENNTPIKTKFMYTTEYLSDRRFYFGDTYEKKCKKHGLEKELINYTRVKKLKEKEGKRLIFMIIWLITMTTIMRIYNFEIINLFLIVSYMFLAMLTGSFIQCYINLKTQKYITEIDIDEKISKIKNILKD